MRADEGKRRIVGGMCVMREQMGTLPDNELFLQKVFSKHVTSAILSMFGAMASMIANSVLAGAFFGADGLALMSIIVPFYSVFAALGSLVGVGGSTVFTSVLILVLENMRKR